jgi:hypothetical protein
MITEQEAIERARRAAEASGWAWLEPVSAQRTGRGWEVFSNVLKRGGNVRVLVDRQSGEISGKGLQPALACARHY